MPPRSATRRKSTWKSKQSELELSLADQGNTVPESENKGQEALSAAVKDEGGEQVAPLVIAGVEIKQELRVLDSNYADKAVMSTAVETKVKEEERNVNVNTVSFMEGGETMEGDHDKFDNAAEEKEVEGEQNEGIHVAPSRAGSSHSGGSSHRRRQIKPPVPVPCTYCPLWHSDRTVLFLPHLGKRPMHGKRSQPAYKVGK